MSDVILEKIYTSEFLLREAAGYRSRDTVMVDQNQTLLPGAVVGVISVGALSSSVVAKTGNVGNGVLTPQGPAPGARPGLYKVLFQDATHFQVFKPNLQGDQVLDGEGVVGQAYAGAIDFTIAAGATAFAEEDQINLTIVAAAGDGNYVAWNPNAEDGSQIVAGVLYSGRTTVAGQTSRVTAITRDAEVKGQMLQWAPGVTGSQQAAAIAQLAGLGIITRY